MPSREAGQRVIGGDQLKILRAGGATFEGSKWLAERIPDSHMPNSAELLASSKADFRGLILMIAKAPPKVYLWSHLSDEPESITRNRVKYFAKKLGDRIREDVPEIVNPHVRAFSMVHGGEVYLLYVNGRWAFIIGRRDAHADAPIALAISNMLRTPAKSTPISAQLRELETTSQSV